MTTLKYILAFISLIILSQFLNQQKAFSQAPQFYYLSSSSNGISWPPFNHNSYTKIQSLYYPSDFNKNLIPGEITNIYLRVGNGAPDTAAYTDLIVKLGMTTLTSLPNGAWTTLGMQEVLNAQYFFFQNLQSNEWVKIPLQIPFNYDGTSNFILEVSQNGFSSSGFNITYNYNPSTEYRKKHGAPNGPYVNKQNPPFFFGFDMCQPISVDLGSDTCFTQPILLEAKGNKGYKYLWNDDSIDSTLFVTSAGTYSVTVISDSGCIAKDTIHLFEPPLFKMADTACNSFTLNGKIYETSGTYTQSFPVNHSICDSIVELKLIINEFNFPVINVNIFELSTTTPYDFYQWMRDGKIIPNAINSKYIVTENGAYQVIVQNADGCGDTSKPYDVTNIDGTNIHYKENSASKFNIYPNPVMNNVFIKNIDGGHIKRISMIDPVGKIVYIDDQIPNRILYKINTSEFSSGIYFLKIETNASSVVKKIEIFR